MAAVASYEAASRGYEEKERESVCVKVPTNFADSLNRNPQVP